MEDRLEILDSMGALRICGYGDIFNYKFLFEIEKLLEQKTSGIYLFSINDLPHYIGQSTNLGSRIVTSYDEKFCLKYSNFWDKKSRVLIDNVYLQYFSVTSKSDLLIYESYLIAKIKPPLNRLGVYPDQTSIKIECPQFSEKIKVIDKINQEYVLYSIEKAKNDMTKDYLRRVYYETH